MGNKKRTEQTRRLLNSNQEVRYQKDFKKADRAGSFKI
ncbi:YfhE family protein [Bacillus carboniphilus]|uniref:YfhE family protein n=1 Tax=Bacillus carboniphilus TaxID=86663 RepID=A0ABY9JTE1_9BACI|nr:YfhE family protein [Bacillus carboniphilus]WLR42666.1 YfhE family protein [Bacillus carboniphilus]